MAAWRAILNVHARVVGRVERELRIAGLPPLPWYDVLWTLRGAPGQRLRMGELAESVTLSRGGLTKLVDRIEAGGFLRREACSEDARGYDAVLTAEGRALLRRMWPVYGRVLREALAHALDEEEAVVIAEALRRVGEPAPAGAGERSASSSS